MSSGDAIVTFERLARVDASWRETVMVTRTGSLATMCHLNGWTSAANRRDLEVSVSCYGTDDPGPDTIQMQCGDETSVSTGAPISRAISEGASPSNHRSTVTVRYGSGNAATALTMRWRASSRSRAWSTRARSGRARADSRR